MSYDRDPQLRLLEGSRDEKVRPNQTPNVPDQYVQDLQRDLNALGYAAGKIDGWFGPRTGDAVRAFQRDARGPRRQEQASALQAGRRFTEESPVYTGEVNGVVDQATALEIRRWKEHRWQRPDSGGSCPIEDIRDRLPINPNLRARIRRPNHIDRLVLHCTDAPPTWGAMACATYDVHPNHISARGCPTITYTYFVNADGLVQKCLSHDVVSWHAGDWNFRGLGVVLAYRATGNAAPPPTAQLEAAAELFARLCDNLGLLPVPNVVGHRELKGTGYVIDAHGQVKLRKECPGLKVNLDEFRQETARRLTSLKASP